MLSAFSFVVLSLVLSVNCSFLDTVIKPCSFKDKNMNECIKEQITKALPIFTKGIPDMGVPSTDPVDLNDIVIDGKGLKLIFTEAKMHGLSGAKLTNLTVTINKEDNPFSLAFKVDLNLTAKYDADGKILILPIQGHGDSVVAAHNVEVIIDGVLVHVKDSKGEEHFKLVTPSYKYTIEKTTFDLQNLFNGNKQLSETTHQFANENWQQLMDELAPPAIKQIVKTIVKAVNKFLSAVTIKQIVKDYD